MGIAYQQLGRLANARTQFRKALDADPSFGEALIGIGDLIVTQVAECGGSQMSREDQAVYWLAADYYERAKSADPSVAQTANVKMQSIRSYYPDSEAIFFMDLERGDSYNISRAGSCYSWIGNETTTVR
jgi:tetratricopeptide (TPR) repeat protein